MQKTTVDSLNELFVVAACLFLLQQDKETSGWGSALSICFFQAAKWSLRSLRMSGSSAERSFCSPKPLHPKTETNNTILSVQIFLFRTSIPLS